MEFSKREKFSYIWRFIFMIFGWFNLFLMMFAEIFLLETEGSSLFASIRPYRFYTIQTNLMVSIWLTVSIILQKNPEKFGRINGSLKGAVLLYITVTFLIYAVFLDGLYTPDSWHSWIIDISTHYIIPIGFIIGWVIDIGNKYKWVSLAYWIIYPHAYFGFALIHGAKTGDFLYPFFNYTLLGFVGVLKWYIILMVVFISLACLYIGINRIVWSKLRKNPAQYID